MNGGAAMGRLTVGKLAKAAGVHVETIRYYERLGLLPEPIRSPGGYRLYSARDVARLRFIKRAQRLGFTLAEIGDLLSLRVEASRRCDAVKARAEAKLADIEAKLETLQRMRGALEALVRACNDRDETSACPILDALELDAFQGGEG